MNTHKKNYLRCLYGLWSHFEGKVFDRLIASKYYVLMLMIDAIYDELVCGKFYCWENLVRMMRLKKYIKFNHTCHDTLMGQNRKCTAEPSRDVKSVRDVKFANNYLNM